MPHDEQHEPNKNMSEEKWLEMWLNDQKSSY
jgi:hypothetical protein